MKNELDTAAAGMEETRQTVNLHIVEAMNAFKALKNLEGQHYGLKQRAQLLNKEVQEKLASCQFSSAPASPACNSIQDREKQPQAKSVDVPRVTQDETEQAHEAQCINAQIVPAVPAGSAMQAASAVQAVTEEPAVPAVPAEPAALAMPAVPAVPSMSVVPTVPASPSVPAEPVVPVLPNVSAMPAMPADTPTNERNSPGTQVSDASGKTGESMAQCSQQAVEGTEVNAKLSDAKHEQRTSATTGLECKGAVAMESFPPSEQESSSAAAAPLFDVQKPEPWLVQRASAKLIVTVEGGADFAGEYRLHHENVHDRPSYKQAGKDTVFLFWLKDGCSGGYWAFGTEPGAAKGLLARSLQLAWTVLPDELCSWSWIQTKNVQPPPDSSCTKCTRISILNI